MEQEYVEEPWRGILREWGITHVETTEGVMTIDEAEGAFSRPVKWRVEPLSEQFPTLTDSIDQLTKEPLS